MFDLILGKCASTVQKTGENFAWYRLRENLWLTDISLKSILNIIQTVVTTSFWQGKFSFLRARCLSLQVLISSSNQPDWESTKDLEAAWRRPQTCLPHRDRRKLVNLGSCCHSETTKKQTSLWYFSFVKTFFWNVCHYGFLFWPLSQVMKQ